MQMIDNILYGLGMALVTAVILALFALLIAVIVFAIQEDIDNSRRGND